MEPRAGAGMEPDAHVVEKTARVAADGGRRNGGFAAGLKGNGRRILTKVSR